MYRKLLYSFLALPVISVAGTTVYTDSAHLPVNPPLMYRLCCSTGHSNRRMLFSARCRPDPEAAEVAVREHMQSPEWQSAQADLCRTLPPGDPRLVAGA